MEELWKHKPVVVKLAEHVADDEPIIQGTNSMVLTRVSKGWRSIKPIMSKVIERKRKERDFTVNRDVEAKKSCFARSLEWAADGEVITSPVYKLHTAWVKVIAYFFAEHRFEELATLNSICYGLSRLVAIVAPGRPLFTNTSLVRVTYTQATNLDGELCTMAVTWSDCSTRTVLYSREHLEHFAKNNMEFYLEGNNLLCDNTPVQFRDTDLLGVPVGTTAGNRIRLLFQLRYVPLKGCDYGCLEYRAMGPDLVIYSAVTGDDASE